MNAPAPVPRSNFVTVLAWLMIAFSALSFLMALFQVVLLTVFLPYVDSINPIGRPTELPSFGFLRIWMLASLPISAFMAYGAYALLKRRNWARIFYIAMFIFTAIIHVVMAAALGFGFSLVTMPVMPDELVPLDLQSTFRAVAIVCAILMLGFSVGYVWLAKRLGSPAVAAEFRDPAAAR